MVVSAKATIQYLNIQPGATALLCMNPDMIGGRMMLVRALVGQWNLHVLPPSSNPIIDANIDFAAMVPLQIESLLESSSGRSFLNKIGQLIIGGANLSQDMVQSLQSFDTQIFQTFGMTETVSHIALKRINGEAKSDDYQLIGDNEIEIDQGGRLSIKGAVTNHQWIRTNDLAEATENGFKWLGRADLVVNSGGVKIHIEPLEKELSAYFKSQIWLWKQADKKLGEQLVGMTEDKDLIASIQKQHKTLREEFKKYHLPKTWVLVQQWHLTPSGKADRAKTLAENF